ncbi:MAG TPA: MMPL family transporter [Candidatus Limnocylindria bacterium]|nr:MMPL family transporter [Candidatus Limnocylindria bacterium]
MLLERYTRWVVRHPYGVLLAVAAVTIWLAFGLGKLVTDFNVEHSLPDDHPFIQTDRAIRAEFGGRNTIMVGIVPRDGDVWRPEILEVVQQVTLTALRLPDIMQQNVVSLAAPAVRHVSDDGGTLMVDYLMREVPRTPEEIAELRRKLESDPSLAGLLVTPDQRAALVILDFYTREGVEHDQLARSALSLAKPFADRPVDFHFAGEPMLAFTNLEQMQWMQRRIPWTFGVIALMMLLSFRSLQGMFIPMLTGTLATVWALGFMGHAGIPIDTWNAAVPILLIAVAAAHSAQMLKRYIEEVARLRDNAAAVIESTVKIGPVMIAAGTTATLGFASLALFGVRSIANFGLSCAAGIAAAVILEMTFIPALRTILPAPRRMPSEGGITKRVLERLQRAVLQRRGRAVLIGTGVAILVSLAGAAHIHTYGDTRIYMPEDSLARRDLEALEQHFKGTTTMTVLYEGEPGSAKSVPVLLHMTALQAEIERDPLTERTASLADLVKTLHKTFNADDPNPYRVPESQELVSQLIFLGESPAFERFTDRSYSKGLLIAYLRSDDSALVGPMLKRLERWLETHPAPEGTKVLLAGGAGPTVLAVNEHTTKGKLLNMLVVLFTIYVVSSVVLRSAAGGLYVITPIVLTVLELFGVIGWAGIRLDMGSATLIAMACGIGADYAIYFLYRLREEHLRQANDADALAAAMLTSGRAVLFVAASIGAGFAVMAPSPFYGMWLFGVLMPTAMLLSCFSALTVMPVMVMRQRPAFVFGPEPAEMPRAA